PGATAMVGTDEQLADEDRRQDLRPLVVQATMRDACPSRKCHFFRGETLAVIRIAGWRAGNRDVSRWEGAPETNALVNGGENWRVGGALGAPRKPYPLASRHGLMAAGRQPARRWTWCRPPTTGTETTGRCAGGSTARGSGALPSSASVHLAPQHRT